MRVIGMLSSNMQRKVVCQFFKWLYKPTCEIGMEVLLELLIKEKLFHSNFTSETIRTSKLVYSWEAWKAISWPLDHT